MDGTVPPAALKAIDVPSPPVNVRLLLAVSVLPSAIVSVEPVAGAVSVTLLTVVAVATPSAGVTNVGDVVALIAPVPLSAVDSAASTPDPRDVVPVIEVPPENVARLPVAGEPVVVTVPDPDPQAAPASPSVPVAVFQLAQSLGVSVPV